MEVVVVGTVHSSHCCWLFVAEIIPGAMMDVFGGDSERPERWRYDGSVVW